MILEVAALWALGVAIVGAWAVARARTRPDSSNAHAASVLVVRPCAGAEAELARCLASLPRTRLATRTLLAVESLSDGAWTTAAMAAATLRLRGQDADVVLTGARGPNRKADQIARAIAVERGDIVVVVDSDIDLEDFDLDALIAPFARVDVAATWAPPVEVAPLTFGDRASMAVLAGSLHAFPLLAALDPRGMVGKVMALRASCLREVGGFESRVDRLGEDMDLARSFAARGWRVECVAAIARSRASGRTVGDVVGRYARWLAVIREQRPLLLVSYPLLFAATPLVVTLALAAWTPGSLAVIAAAIAARVGVAVGARRASGMRPSFRVALFDAVAGDALLLCAFVRALVTRDVRWRARTLRFERRGHLAHEELAG